MGKRELANVSLGKIRANPVALRDANKNSEEFQELVGSVRLDGVQNPVLLRRKAGEDGKEFELVDGLQRFSASQEVGTGIPGEVEMIPAYIIEKDDAEALLSQIVGNAHRIETKPADYARAIMRILGYYPMMTEAELAGKLNKSPAWISKQLQLLKLHDQVKPLVNAGQVPLANAYSMSKLPPEEQMDWLERAQTMQAAEFGPAVLARVKEIRDANRKGKDANPEQFVAVAHLRKKTEIEPEVENPATVLQLVNDLNVLEGIKPNREGLLEAARRAAALTLQWVLNTDPKSVESQKAKWEERKAHEADQKIRRDAEKKEARAKEYAEKEKAAREEADKAREAAGKLPAEPAAV